MSTDWKEVVPGYEEQNVDNPLAMTMRAARQANQIYFSDDFLNGEEAKGIFKTFSKNIVPLSFGEQLKRYVYIKAELTEPFDEGPDSVYREIITSSFHYTHTPKSFHETGTRFSAIVNNWLRQNSVTRENVFLLGFGLSMPVDDVSMFLKDVLMQQDFNLNNPEEAIYKFCLEKGYPAGRAISFVEEYATLEADPDAVVFDNRTMSAHNKFNNINSDEALIAYLKRLKYNNREYPFSYTAKNEFVSLLGEVKEEIAAQRNEEHDAAKRVTASDISDGDVEQTINNGSPIDAKGNLAKASASMLKKSFANMRLSRQRIGKILNDKAAVSRSDLINLKFYLASRRTLDMDPVDRYYHFIDDTNQMLKKCYMGELNIKNPYEAFVLLCLLTDDPMAIFSEVWEQSFERAEEE